MSSLVADLDRAVAVAASVREGLITGDEARQLLRTERANALRSLAEDPSNAVDVQAAVDYLYRQEPRS